jgi:hypothetical protein
VRVAVPVANTRAAGLTHEQRTALRKPYEDLYDSEHGGWGTVHKFLDAPTLEYTFSLLSNEQESALATQRARQTLEANLSLIDPVWGGVYQYSDEANWKSPHFEKLLAFQAHDLRLYSLAYAQWQDPKYLKAALAVRRYLVTFLASPEGPST